MTSYSGLWNNEYGENHSLLSNVVGNTLTAFSRVFANRLYGRAGSRELLYALVGAAAGGTAVATHKRIQAERDLYNNVLGGDRTIETFTAVNRVTTAEDVADFKEALRLPPKPAYAADRSGNGGGAKLGW